jgi:hypothetical protein
LRKSLLNTNSFIKYFFYLVIVAIADMFFNIFLHLYSLLNEMSKVKCFGTCYLQVTIHTIIHNGCNNCQFDRIHNNKSVVPLVYLTMYKLEFVDVLKHEILKTFHRKRNFCACIVVYGTHLQSKTTVYPISQK